MRNHRIHNNAPSLRFLRAPVPRWSLWVAATAAILAPQALPAQSRNIDEGTLRIRVGATDVAREEFSILRGRSTTGGGGFRILATAFYPPRRTRVTMIDSVLLGPDSLPRLADFLPSQPNGVRTVAQFGPRILTLRKIDPGGESFREYPGVDRNWVVDDSMATLYAVPPGTHDGPVRLVSRQGERSDFQLTNRGIEETDVDGRQRELSHLVLTRGDDTRHLWYDGGEEVDERPWRLMKVEIPARRLVAERILESILPSR